ILRHNSIELQKLIEDLLSFGSSQFRKVTVELQPVEIRRIVERVTAAHMLAAKARGVTFETAVDDIMLAADAEKLRVVVDNLVSNAVKFSPAGGRIRVLGRLDGAAIELDVMDEGPGIPPAERSRIFDPFYQGGRPGASRVRGTGI